MHILVNGNLNTQHSSDLDAQVINPVAAGTRATMVRPGRCMWHSAGNLDLKTTGRGDFDYHQSLLHLDNHLRKLVL